MKKKILAVGVAATLGALSGVSNAALTVQPGGVGQINILPYYTVQNGNTTLISIANTDELNGKAVKVRFRGAEFSDDVFDFQLFLSPADVWTAAITLDGGVARMNTVDNSCTIPAKSDLNAKFVTARLKSPATGTREGYVEIINMGDIVKVPNYVEATATATQKAQQALYTATKHVAGVAPCTASVLVGDVANPNDLTGSLTSPTSGLTSFAVILNVAETKAFTVPATAIAQNAATAVPVRFARQARLTAGTTSAGFAPIAFGVAQTADGVFSTNATAGGNVKMYEFDLPDLSTPYGTADTTAQLSELQAALAKSYVKTEYASDTGIDAMTDVVLSQPTRRYYYTWTDVTAAEGDTKETLATVKGAIVGSPYEGLNATANTIEVGAPSLYNREEGTVASGNAVVISPNPESSAVWELKGEVSVLSINNTTVPTGALGASLTAKDYTFDLVDGWARLSTTTKNHARQLPVIGFTAVNVFNDQANPGTNYGQVLPLKWDAVLP